MRAAQDIMFRNTNCVNQKSGCSRCLEACPYGAIQVNPSYCGDGVPQLLFDRRLCNQCPDHPCLDVCYFEGLRLCGDWRSVSEVMHVLHRNRHYWGVDGGVSFSGGEPLLQSAFIRAMLQACQAEKMHTAVETTAHIRTDTFLELMPLVNFAFIDVKHMDSLRHKEKTGVANDLILKNIAALGGSGWSGRLVLRMPAIPGFNMDRENIEAVAEFMQKNGLVEINVLPFHRLGDSKWKQLGKEYAYQDCKGSCEDDLLQIQDYFLERRIACYLGSDTPF